jgi:hypothetical protein
MATQRALFSLKELLDEVFNFISIKFPLKRKKGIDLIVGIYTERDKTGISMHQTPLIDEIGLCAGVTNPKPTFSPTRSTFKGFKPSDVVTDPKLRVTLDKWPYLQVLGKICYVAQGTRYDALQLAAELRRYQANYGPYMIEVLEYFVAFLVTTKHQRLRFNSGYGHPINLFTMVDSSFTNCSTINTLSHGGFVVMLLGCAIMAVSKRQRITALSSCESEFIQANEAGKATVWLARIVEGFGMKVRKPVPMLEDNRAAIFLSERPNLNGGRTRHMDVRWHWLQEQVADGMLALAYLETEHQVADILTKPLQRPQFQRLARQLLGQEPTMSEAVVRSLERAGERLIAAAASAARHMLITETLDPEEQYEHEERANSARELYQPTVGERDNAAMNDAGLMVGSEYSSDVTGDGPAHGEDMGPHPPARRRILGEPAFLPPMAQIWEREHPNFVPLGRALEVWAYASWMMPREVLGHGGVFEAGLLPLAQEDLWRSMTWLAPEASSAMDAQTRAHFAALMLNESRGAIEQFRRATETLRADMNHWHSRAGQPPAYLPDDLVEPPEGPAAAEQEVPDEEPAVGDVNAAYQVALAAWRRRVNGPEHDVAAEEPAEEPAEELAEEPAEDPAEPVMMEADAEGDMGDVAQDPEEWYVQRTLAAITAAEEGRDHPHPDAHVMLRGMNGRCYHLPRCPILYTRRGPRSGRAYARGVRTTNVAGARADGYERCRSCFR